MAFSSKSFCRLQRNEVLHKHCVSSFPPAAQILPKRLSFTDNSQQYTMGVLQAPTTLLPKRMSFSAENCMPCCLRSDSPVCLSTHHAANALRTTPYLSDDFIVVFYRLCHLAIPQTERFGNVRNWPKSSIRRCFGGRIGLDSWSGVDVFAAERLPITVLAAPDVR